MIVLVESANLNRYSPLKEKVWWNVAVGFKDWNPKAKPR
jgi:hypothetical protein